MNRKTLGYPLFLSLLLMLSGAGGSTQPICEVGIYRDSSFPPFAYKAVLLLDSSCPRSGIAYVRKTSSLSRKEYGSHVQPAVPDGTRKWNGKWSWKITREYTEVPAEQLWTINVWHWEYLTPQGQWEEMRLP